MKEKKRMPNMELLRCVAMMMVIVLHFLGKGKLLPDLAQAGTGGAGVPGWTGTVAWMLEALAIVAVNLYMFISGYFLCTSSFKLSRLLGLWLRLWLYSVMVGVLAARAGIVLETSVDTHYYLTLLFPVSMGHYWFMTAYLFLYVCLPLVGTAVRGMTRQQLATACILMLVVFSLVKSVLPFRLESDMQGYDFVWYLCVFLVAAYIRRFGMPLLERRGRGLALYLICSVLILCVTLILRELVIRTGSFSRILTVCYEYNHVLPFLGAMGLFMAFMRVKVPDKLAGCISKIAPHTLGVYLLHENIGIRYSWESLFGANLTDSVWKMLLAVLLAVFTVFTVGILFDMVLGCVLRLIHKLGSRFRSYEKLMEGIGKVDAMFARDRA